MSPGLIIDFSAAVALFGHVGIEWDLTATDDETRGRIAAWVELAKRLRPLVASGRTVDVDGTVTHLVSRSGVDPAGNADTAALALLLAA